MARSKPRTLTRAEIRVMAVLWDRRRATVADVVEALPAPPLAYTTVLTMLRVLERKAIVARSIAGRKHVYRPIVERDDAATSAVGDLVRSFFADRKTALAVRLMAEERPSSLELDSIKALIAAYERENA